VQYSLNFLKKCLDNGVHYKEGRAHSHIYSYMKVVFIHLFYGYILAETIYNRIHKGIIKLQLNSFFLSTKHFKYPKRTGRKGS